LVLNVEEDPGYRYPASDKKNADGYEEALHQIHWRARSDA